MQTTRSQDGFDAAVGYWTPERRKSAIPFPALEERLYDPPYDKWDLRRFEDSEVVDASQGNLDMKPAPAQIIMIRTGRLGTRVTDRTVKPYRAIGKLYFVWDGKRYVGSGAIIAPNTVLTAAHNLRWSDYWSEHFLFVPGFDASDEWSGGLCYPHRWADVNSRWMESQNFEDDYGLLSIAGLPKSLGWLEVSYEAEAGGNDVMFNREIEAVGYPDEHPHNGGETLRVPYNGGEMIRVRGECKGVWKGRMAMDRNDMTRGASGGPWLIREGSGEYKVVGLTSTHNGEGFDLATSPVLKRELIASMVSRLDSRA